MLNKGRAHPSCNNHNCLIWLDIKQQGREDLDENRTERVRKRLRRRLFKATKITYSNSCRWEGILLAKCMSYFPLMAKKKKKEQPVITGSEGLDWRYNT